jgi:GT2 family glycosyltransferase
VQQTTIVIPSVFHDQLQWFLDHNAKQVRNSQVIVVSSDPKTTQNFLDEHLPNAQLIALEKPIGFAKTVNLGMRQATADWIGTCNDDVVISNHWVESLLAAATDKTGGVNSVIFDPEGKIESAGISILSVGKAVPKTTDIPTTPFATEALNAACVLYRREALQQAGYFDERFGSYLEDIDLSLTLNKLGWQQLVVPSVTVIHLKHQTSGKVLGWKKSYYDARNWWLILFKHWSWQQWLSHLPGILLERLRNIFGMIKAMAKS